MITSIIALLGVLFSMNIQIQRLQSGIGLKNYAHKGIEIKLF